MSGIVLPALDTALDCSVAPGYSALGYWLRGLRWDNAVAGRLDGGAAVVTGASSGLGVAAVEGLARAGARVHLVVRDRERGERARDEVLQRLGAAADLRVALCDLAELESVARLAADLAEREPDLAVLVNNAGVLAERRERSSSGAELTFATNVLGPFALTELLLPALRAGTPGRVVTVSSGGMYTARLDGADLQLDHRTFRRPALLRPHQAGRGRPQRALERARGRGRRALCRHAPGLGRHAGPAALAAPLPPAHAAGAARRPPGRRHHRLAGHRARGRGSGRQVLARPAPPAHPPAAAHARIGRGPPGAVARVPAAGEPMSRVAVVGAGVAGLVAAYELDKAGHDVHLFEAAGHAGGHANTVAVETEAGTYDVDTGFVVLQRPQLPQLRAAARRARGRRRSRPT